MFSARPATRRVVDALDAIGPGRVRAGLAGGWSFGGLVAADPVVIFEASGGDPFWRLESALRERPDLLWVGFISYDAGRCVERLPSLVSDDIGVPDVWFAGYSGWIEVDLFGRLHQMGDPKVAGRICENVRDAVQRSGMSDRGVSEGGTLGVSGSPAGRSLTRGEYLTCVAGALDKIAAGDFYQVNLAQRFSVPILGRDAIATLRNLWNRLDPDYGAFLEVPTGSTPPLEVCSASPELFLELDSDGSVVTRPIKGTRPRYRDAELDRASRSELTTSAKDRAENVMIVDLERNDLGKVCAPGSIRVPELCAVHSYAAIHHLVSTVEGRLEPGVGLAQLLRATFPGGSITGAPKVAAMRYIEGSEKVRRGVYTGAIGRIGPLVGSREGAGVRTVQLELNVAIRTVVRAAGQSHLWVGSGIVADSVPEAEYDESISKATGLAESIGMELASARI